MRQVRWTVSPTHITILVWLKICRWKRKKSIFIFSSSNSYLSTSNQKTKYQRHDCTLWIHIVAVCCSSIDDWLDFIFYLRLHNLGKNCKLTILLYTYTVRRTVDTFADCRNRLSIFICRHISVTRAGYKFNFTFKFSIGEPIDRKMSEELGFHITIYETPGNPLNMTSKLNIHPLMPYKYQRL